MARRLSIAAVAVSSALLAGCAGMGGSGGSQVPEGAFRLYSPAYADNQIVERKHASNNKANPNCIGDNVSPALAWNNPPPKTRSYAIIMDDQAGQAGLGVSHMVVYGIPADVRSFAEGELSAPSQKYVGGANLLKVPGYFGPCTPKGNAPQHYVFTMIATDLEPTALKPGLSRQELLAALKGRALRAASYVMRFVNP